VFRGLLYRSLRRKWNVELSIAVMTGLFITSHPVTSYPALLVLGTVIAWTTEKTCRLWPSELIYAGYNLMFWGLWFLVSGADSASPTLVGPGRFLDEDSTSISWQAEHNSQFLK
jgi:membrane protease YdiL (CAAX protease family)